MSILPTVSKIFERIMQKQIIDYINQYISPLLCGYEKTLVHKRFCIILLKNGSLFLGPTLMDLSKPFDTINHKFLVAKRNGYGFSKEKSRLIFSYLNNRKQRVKINETFKLMERIIIWCTTGICVGANFLNIYLNDLFLFLNKIDVCNFANDTTSFL